MSDLVDKAFANDISAEKYFVFEEFSEYGYNNAYIVNYERRIK